MERGVCTGKGGSFVARRHRFTRAGQLDVAAAERTGSRSNVLMRLSTQSTSGIQTDSSQPTLDFAIKVV